MYSAYKIVIKSTDQVSAGEMLDLYRFSYGKTDNKWTKNIDRRYGNPKANHHGTVIQLFSDNGQLIGSATIFSLLKTCGDQVFHTAQLADLMIHPEHRGIGTLTTIYKKLDSLLNTSNFDVVFTVPNQKSFVLNSRYLKLELKREFFPKLLVCWPWKTGKSLLDIRKPDEPKLNQVSDRPIIQLIVQTENQFEIFTQIRKFGIPLLIRAGIFDGCNGEINNSNKNIGYFGFGLEYVNTLDKSSLLGKITNRFALRMQGKALSEKGKKFEFNALQPLDFDFFWY